MLDKRKIMQSTVKYKTLFNRHATQSCIRTQNDFYNLTYTTNVELHAICHQLHEVITNSPAHISTNVILNSFHELSNKKKKIRTQRRTIVLYKFKQHTINRGKKHTFQTH